MHELGIAFYIIDMVEDLGRQNDLTSVARVKLRLGRFQASFRRIFKTYGVGLPTARI